MGHNNRSSLVGKELLLLLRTGNTDRKVILHVTNQQKNAASR